MSTFPGLWGLNLEILPLKIQGVSEYEDNNNETMSEGRDGDNEGALMDDEDKAPDDIRYNV